MSGPVGHKCQLFIIGIAVDPRLLAIKDFANCLHDLSVGSLALSTHIVITSGSAMLQNQINRATEIGD